jgi:tetratricopeptide (TPR) repeat protein
MSRKIFCAFIMILGVYSISVPLWADTADDYYREANSFFMQKDYQRALDAYQGAIPFDSNPYRAYMGMGNCEYSMGNQIKAVEYLQKSDDIHKDLKIEAFITKIKTTIPKPKTPLFVKAETCLQKRQYKEAIPILKEVEQYEPTNFKAYYDLGYCYYIIGDKPEATLNFAYYESKTKDTTVAGLVTKMKSQLTVDDQEWVDAQVQLGPPFSSPFRFSGIGIRFEPTFQFTSLKDFNNFAMEMQRTGNAAAPDSSFSLSPASSAPPGGLGIDLNPYVQIGENLEVGLTFGTLFLGQFNASYTDLNYTASNVVSGDAAFTYQVIEAGISLRAEPFMIYKNKIKFFVEADPSYYITSLSSANSEITNPAPNPGFDFPMVTGNFSGSGIGSRFKIGVDWKPLPNSLVSGFLGYQLAQIQGFTGSGLASGGYSGVPAGSPVNMPGQLETQQGPNGTRIIFVPNGVTVPGATPSPLTLDLSGFIIGADMTILL